MSYKVELIDKKKFTGEELELIKSIKADEEFQGTVKDIMSVLKGNGRKILNSTLAWTFNRISPSETFWGNGIDIYVEAYVLDNDKIRYILTDFSQINQVCDGEDFENLGYQQIYAK